MRIDVKIPYEPGDLAFAYNRAMEESYAKWILLLDHDVFLSANKYWYEILQQGINQLEELDRVGLITCVKSGAIKGTPQCSDIYTGKDEHDMKKHVKIARILYENYGNLLKPVDTYRIGGLFMLVNKEVWRRIKFRTVKSNDIRYIDWDFTKRILKNDYKIYVMPGLYIYHGKEVNYE